MRTEINHTNELTIPLTISGVELDNRPSFAQADYAEMVRELRNNYLRLRTFMTTPAIVRYDELASLRRRSVNPDLSNPSYNRYQAPLRLAADLLRLGRREEGLLILKEMEERLQEWQNPTRSLCFLLWIAIMRAAAGERQSAFYLALQVASHATDSKLDNSVISFFRTVRTPVGAIAS